MNNGAGFGRALEAYIVLEAVIISPAWGFSQVSRYPLFGRALYLSQANASCLHKQPGRFRGTEGNCGVAVPKSWLSRFPGSRDIRICGFLISPALISIDEGHDVARDYLTNLSWDIGGNKE